MSCFSRLATEWNIRALATNPFRRAIPAGLVGGTGLLSTLFPRNSTSMPWHTEDYPVFLSPWAQACAAGAMLVLFGIYAWASVALGFKASNLTNRGIVQSGPYAHVRHPAYIAKNLAWWIGLLPWILSHATTEPVAAIGAVLGMAGWSCLYGFTVTEERPSRPRS